MTEELTPIQAYKAMCLYLEKLYQMTGSDDLGGFLGGMSMLEDGSTADPAAWHDWMQAVDESKQDPSINLTFKD